MSDNITEKAKVAPVHLGKDLVIEGLMLPNGIYAIGKKNPKSDYPEHYYRDGLHGLLGGKCESLIKGTRLRVDLELESCVIEVKSGMDFTNAVGQVLHYAHLLKKVPVIAFFGSVKASEVELANNLGITCINVERCYKVNKSKPKKKEQDITPLRITPVDYSDFEELISGIQDKHLFAFKYVRDNPEKVLLQCVDNNDHYSLWFFFSLITHLSCFETMRLKYFHKDSLYVYPFLIPQKMIEEKMRESNASLINVLHDVYIWLIHFYTQELEQAQYEILRQTGMDHRSAVAKIAEVSSFCPAFAISNS